MKRMRFYPTWQVKKLGCLNFMDVAKRDKTLGTETKDVYFSQQYEQLKYRHLWTKDHKVKQRPTNSQKMYVPCITDKGYSL